jgi:MoxR-like ATPase
MDQPATLMEKVLYEVKKTVVGQDHFLERVLVAMLAQGHLLVEGVPGLAKTLTVKTLAQAVHGSFRRIQFTPDLVPADLVGTRIYNQKTGEFATSLGPVFCNLLLADEINRAPAKVQSALLEVMQEHQVTIAGETHKVPDPFLVMATQNPIETEGTYPLQRECRKVYVEPSLIQYAVRLSNATRAPDKYLTYGASPRASIHLIEGARALAYLRGRDYTLPEDVTDLVPDVFRHRLVLSYEALAEGLTADDLVQKVMQKVRAPAKPLHANVKLAAAQS